MKPRYLIFLIVLGLFALVFEAVILRSGLGGDPRLENAIQSAGIFVALVAAVIALSTADPKRKNVSVSLEGPFIDDVRERREDELSDELREYYRSYPVRSYRVHFRMKNVSGSELKSPVFTFRVPLDRRPPNQGPDGKFSVREFTWGPAYGDVPPRVLDVGDDRIISHSGLLYWNNDDVLDFWIRMVLDIESPAFQVIVAINCENAGGYWKALLIDPPALLGRDSAVRTSDEESGVE